MKREQGVVEILCKEIDFRFCRSMETDAIFISFVSVLVSEVENLRAMINGLASMMDSKLSASTNSGEVLGRVNEMLLASTSNEMIRRAADVHHFIREIVPEDVYPCDHLIDMLSSCVSAIRFGLEKPCQSRHAAEASNHIWRHKYGVSLFDDFTPAWQKEWSRAQLQKAILRLVPFSAKQ